MSTITTSLLRLLAAATVALTVLGGASLRGAADTGAVAANPLVRIEMTRYYAGLSVVTVTCDQPFTVSDDTGKLIVSEPAQQPVDIALIPPTAGDSRPGLSVFQPDQEDSTPIEVTGVRFHLSATGLAPTFTVARLDGAAHGYRGDLWVTPLPTHTLRLVNQIDLEDYLLGVVKAEIGGDVAIEAMKAQAVAARTYTIRNMGRLWQEEADLDDTTRSQGYLGRDGETPQVAKAVSDTSGQILAYEGAAIDAMYSTDCGGVTAPGPPDEPYLKAVKEPLCAGHKPWIITLTAAELESALGQSQATQIQNLEKVEIASKDASGRAEEVALVSSDGFSETVSGVKLRQLLGVNVLRSTLFTVKELSKGVWEFRGQGWGHGMGMCQAGAIARASQSHPETYDQILGDYYCGAKLVPLTPDLIPSPAHAYKSAAAL